ncbi:MAG TPA: hypothetical protein VFJ63_01410 [Candidatus Bathyarchaeia archaeon]|nr:hypothetical protein [Candidatus Bathyarchaeia archaeon]
MRAEVFLLGVLMVIIGPIITFISASSCFGMILSGNVFGCVTDIAYIAIGGTFFVVGITTALIGLIMPDPIPNPPAGIGYTPRMQGPEIKCPKCGQNYSSSLFFCPSCGQRPV